MWAVITSPGATGPTFSGVARINDVFGKQLVVRRQLRDLLGDVPNHLGQITHAATAVVTWLGRPPATIAPVNCSISLRFVVLITTPSTYTMILVQLPSRKPAPSGALDDQRDALADESNQLRTGKFKIETWDAGWWQVRSALKDRDLCTIDLAAVKMAHEALRDKLRPQLAEFGFLDEGLESATVEPARSVRTSE